MRGSGLSNIFKGGFNLRTKTYNFQEFIRNEHKTVKAPTYSLVPLASASIMPTTVFAETSIQTKVMSAFEPLIDVIIAFAYPASLAVMMGGALFVIFGNSERGFGMIQKAAMGYIALMLLPMIFEIFASAVSGVN